MDNKLLNDYIHKDKKINISRIFTKLLLSITLLLLSLIYVKTDNNNLALFKKHVFGDNFNFASFNSLYNSLKNNNETIPVMNNLKYTNKTKYQDGYRYQVSDSLIETFTSGIVVYVGQKDDYNNTVIIQGSDGYDIWYGNLDDVNVTIYDYINKNTIIGETDNLYLKVVKDGKIVKIDDYLHI